MRKFTDDQSASAVRVLRKQGSPYARVLAGRIERGEVVLFDMQANPEGQ